MSSSVHFKFKSQKEPSRVTFDGTAISVFDLKREIITINRLGDGSDFELSIYNEGDNTEYDDDTTLIPRSTSVIARRLPAIRPGRGGAARYVSGKAPVNARHAPANEAAKSHASSTRNKGPDMSTAQTEEERIKAMFNLEGEQWRQKQQEMATEQRVPFGAGKAFPPKKNSNIPEGEPPRGYVCYRCGKKGHWIQACPTNDDPTFEGKARIKRTTGIPRSMLKTIDKSELENLDEATRQQMMINGDGEYVIAQTDEKEWKKHQERVKASAAAQERANKGDQELQTRGLECPIDKRLFVDPVKTPCCQRTYCNECISTALIDSDLTCPSCSTENVTLEELVSDDEIQVKVDAYRSEKAAEKKQGDDTKSTDSSPKVKAATPTKSSASSPPGSQSPSAGSSNGNVASKKRSAEEISDSKSLAPTAPEMKRQRSGEGSKDIKALPATANNTTALPVASSMPNLPFNQIMPPDMTQMMQSMGGQNMNFPMPMPMPMTGMPGMPFMPNMNMSMMNPGLMGNFVPPNFNMNGMNGMDMMNGMNGMNGANGMNGMSGMNSMNFMNGMNGMNFPTNQQAHGNFHPPNNSNINGNNFGQQKMHPNHRQNNQLAGVPTGPRKATVPSGPSMANKFSNQQRHLGKEEDNAYMRQPVNPHRHQNRQKRVRPSDYRELGA